MKCEEVRRDINHMKKRVFFILAIVMTLFLGVTVAAESSEAISVVTPDSKELGITLEEKAQVLEHYYFHGWFGDGQDYTVYEIKKEEMSKIIKEIKNNKQWRKVRLNEIVDVSMQLEDEKNHKKVSPKNTIPIKVKDGYYFYNDRFSKQYSQRVRKEKKEIFKNYKSLKETFGVLDKDNNKLYVYRIDH